MGQVAADKGYKNIVTVAWRYGFGTESVEGFKEGFEKAGGTVSKEIYVPFPDVEFQSQLTEIAALKPDAVFVFLPAAGRPSLFRITRRLACKARFRCLAQASSPKVLCRPKAPLRRVC